ncbi:MAG TPA: hypothetical protein VF545_02510 [Thermoleophilaceae bacterium]|jgi:hypothetical protein
MIRRATIAVAACGAMLGVAAPSAFGEVDRTISKCEGTATWQVTINFSGQSSAVRTLSAPTNGCRNVHAAVEDNGNFSIDSNNESGSSTVDQPSLIGAGVTGIPAFAGVITSPSGKLRGPIVIVGDSLYATVVNVDAPATFAASETHTAAGSCGTNCYRTKAVWITSGS